MNVLRAIWRFLVGVKDALALLFLLLFFGLLYAALSARPVFMVPSGSALTLDLNGTIVDQPAEQSPLAMLAGESGLVHEIRLRDVVRSINAAATDSRIKALVLDLDSFMGAGPAHLQTVGEALREFRAAGKPIYSFATAYTDDGYYLASFANEIWSDPLGGVLLTGPGGNGLYFKGLLDKLSVTIELFKVGTYKAAVEPFTRTDQSPEAEEAAQALADTIWQIWLSDVSRARDRARVASYIANLPARMRAANGDLARAGVNAGLIDHLGHRSDFARRIAGLVGAGPSGRDDEWNAAYFADYAAASAHNLTSRGPSVGVVYVAGEIVDGEALPGTAGGDTIADLVNDALTNDNIKALVVRVDSPGGSVMASEQIRSALMNAKRRNLPVIVSMGALAASGGYWVSTVADTIFAEPATITGSIGVFAIVPTFENTLGKIGLSADGVKTTPYSGQPDLLTGLTPDTRALLQLSVENIYGRFLGLVARARKMTPARVDVVGQGRVWAGATARQLGLVDRFGSLDDAIAEAARRANIPAGKPHVIYIEKTPSLPFQLLSQFVEESEGQQQQQARDPWGMLASRDRQTLLRAVTDASAIASGPALQARCLECGVPRHQPSTTAERSLLASIVKVLAQ